MRDEEGTCPICGMNLVAKAVGGGGETALEHAQKHLDPKYVCPMHPQIVRDEEGTCPICGMDLVAKSVDAGTGGRPTVEISNAVINSMGVRTATAANTTLWKYIETVGRIDYDETLLAHVHPRAAGWMETLKLRAEGEPVKKGQLIGRLYSEEILSAQVDFLVVEEELLVEAAESAQQRRADDEERTGHPVDRRILFGIGPGPVETTE